MSENEEKKNVDAGKRSFRLINIGICFSTLAVLVLITAFSYGYSEMAKAVNGIQSQANASNVEMQRLQDALKEVQSSTEKSQELSARQEQMINDWKESQKGNFEKWHVAEAEYMVRLANDHVLFTHNTLMALTLLQRADKILENLNDGGLMPIRKSIADDIATLLATPQVDTTQLYLLLTALNDQISRLPLPVGPMQKFEEPPVETTVNGSLPWWRAGWNNTWSALKKIVIVRYNGANSPPLVLPEEREYLYQNLRAQIETAIWAGLHGDKQIYQTSLSQAAAWVQQYFVMTAPETQSMLQRLQSLKELNVQPPKANLTPTLQLFDQYLNKAV